MVLFEPIHLTDAVLVAARTGIVFLYAFLILRLLGRRRLSHLMYTDILLIIALGSAVGDVMIYGESTAHLLTSLVAITVVAVIVKTLDELSSHSVRAGHLITGSATLLIDKGVLVPGALEKADISEEHLLSLLREKDVHTIKNVRKAFIEPDGEVSVLPYKR